MGDGQREKRYAFWTWETNKEVEGTQGNSIRKRSWFTSKNSSTYIYSGSFILSHFDTIFTFCLKV